MSEEPVRFIRESTRNLLKLNRKVHKDDLTDIGRDIDSKRLTPDSVTNIANKLKTKSTASVGELHTLKNCLIEDSKNVNIVLSTHGSLKGIVRELSGNDVKRQCAAAGCCCNLALADSKSCGAVAKAAGPYLVATLDNLSTELAVTCAWALGNMAGSGPKVCETLAAQGAIAKLVSLLDTSREEVREAAEYALVHFAYHLKDELSQEYVKHIIEACTKNEIVPSHLLFILSCHAHFRTYVTKELVLKILETATVSIEKHINDCKGVEMCCELVYVLRILANALVDQDFSYVLTHIASKNIGDSFRNILLSDNLLVKESLLWLLGNMYKACGDNDFINSLVL